MSTRARFLVLYLFYWVLFFESARILFLLYEWRHTENLDAALVLGTLVRGFPMDVSTACALTLVPVCLVARDGFLPSRLIRRLLTGYTLLLLFVAALAVVADLEIFKVWGFRIDASALRFLSTPSEAFASASGSPLFLLSGIFIALLVAAIVVFRIAVLPFADRLPPITQSQSLLMIVVLFPTLAVAAQGGFRWRIPMTASSVFFSHDPFANRAAVNAVWNLAVSATDPSTESRVERFTRPEVAKRIVDSLLAQSTTPDTGARTKLLSKRPSRIVLLLWEGLTAKVVEPLGGREGITPGFTRLSGEGILFDSLYSSGSRTTNGLVAVLSGFPSHPVTGPLSSSPRSAALPSLSTELSKAGYRTGYYYGAPLEFDNRLRYLMSGHYDEILEKKDIDPVYWKSPWGAHDPYTLGRLFSAVDSGKAPVFAVTLTLSSHEPFRVPPPALIRGNKTESRFLNAQAYTDKAVASFVERLKASSWWDSTLLIIVADHGSPYPFRGPAFAAAPEQYRIPMLWLGGALAVRDTVIHHTLSQFDIPKVLLGQLGLPSDRFIWGKDIFAPGASSFAFYSFSNGFGFVDPTGSYVFDNAAKSVVHYTGKPSVAALVAGRAFQQILTQEYVNMSRPERR
ncbi:MAG: LTA synthase family protein [Gemmatimonadales bacterium]